LAWRWPALVDVRQLPLPVRTTEREWKCQAVLDTADGDAVQIALAAQIAVDAGLFRQLRDSPQGGHHPLPIINEDPPRSGEAERGKYLVRQDRVVPLVFRVNDSAVEARLVVPRRYLAGLQQNQTAAAGVGGFVRDNRLGTVVAGLCLSLAAGWVGLRLARGKAALDRRALAAAAGLVLVIAGTTLAWAGALPEPAGPTGPTIVVEVVEQGEAVEFFASRATLASFQVPPADSARPASPPGK
jgi:hypothetical protein